MIDNDLSRSRRNSEELRTRAERGLKEARRRSSELKRVVDNEFGDPLSKGPLDTVSAVEFLPNGSLNMSTVGRVISRWMDDSGNEFYTTTRRLPIDQIRATRDRVVAQQRTFGTLSEDEKATTEAEHNRSAGQSAVSRPYGDYLRSQQLGERFAYLKQNPPRPFARKVY